MEMYQLKYRVLIVLGQENFKSSLSISYPFYWGGGGQLDKKRNAMGRGPYIYLFVGGWRTTQRFTNETD